MWACCDDTSSDDGEHNTSNALLLLIADALIAPVLLAGLSDVDELMVALGCMFALDFLSVAQQERPPSEPDLLAHDPGHALWFEALTPSGPPAFSTADVHDRCLSTWISLVYALLFHALHCTHGVVLTLQ